MLVDKVFPEFKSGYYNVVPLHCRIIQQHVLFTIFLTSPLNYYFCLTLKSTYQDAFKNVKLSLEMQKNLQLIPNPHQIKYSQLITVRHQ